MRGGGISPRGGRFSEDGIELGILGRQGMIRFAGFAHCSYDFSESVAEGPHATRHNPDGTPCSNVPESALLFRVLVYNASNHLRSRTAFVLVPSDLDETAIFERLRICLKVQRYDREGRAYCTNCGAKITTAERSCSRCGAAQLSIQSVGPELESLELRARLQAKILCALGVGDDDCVL